MNGAWTDPGGRRALQEVLDSGGLLAFQLEGALAPPPRERADAAVGITTRELLGRLAGVHPCAVVSGRARNDVVDRLRGLPLAEVIGTHGAEPLPAGTDELLVRRRVALWYSLIAPSLLDIPGVEIEDRGVSLALHFGRTRDRARAERGVRLALERVDGARFLERPGAVDILPQDLPDLAGALRRVCARLGVHSALVVGERPGGDDTAELSGLGYVRFLRTSPSTSSTEAQTSIDDLLRTALDLAPRGPASATGSTARG